MVQGFVGSKVRVQCFWDLVGGCFGASGFMRSDGLMTLWGVSTWLWLGKLGSERQHVWANSRTYGP